MNPSEQAIREAAYPEPFTYGLALGLEKPDRTCGGWGFGGLLDHWRIKLKGEIVWRR
jgi:hypothetical protein